MTELPVELAFGKVVARIILAVADSSDAGRLPDAMPASGTIVIIPKVTNLKTQLPEPVMVIKKTIVCTLDASGYLMDSEDAVGVWLVTGIYQVTYSIVGATIKTHDIEVLDTHTDANPLDLTNAMPPDGAVLSASQFAELSGRVDTISPGPRGPAGPATTDASLLDSGTVAEARLPENLAASALTAAFADKTATTNALGLKAPVASPAFTGTPTGITKTHVGLSNVDNTSDLNKPVSGPQTAAFADKTATTNALGLKAPLIAPTFAAVTPAAVMSADLAPALSAWILAGSAVYTATQVAIGPAAGSMSFDLAVVAGRIYQVDITASASSGGNFLVSVGAASIDSLSSQNKSVTVTALVTSTVTLTISGVSWSGTVTAVVVRGVTSLQSPAVVAASMELRQSGSSNAVGYNAQLSLTTGSYNNAVGHTAQKSLTTGSSNNAVGYAAQYALTTGSFNNAVGYNAQLSLTTGSSNNAVGYAAQLSLTTGSSNNAVGYAAQYVLTTGSYNNAVGHTAQKSLTTGSSNNAVGYAAQYALTTGSFNNAVGYAAQYALTTGSFNNAVGQYAQYALTTGSYNNAVGYNAQQSLTTGSYNNAVGHTAQYAPLGNTAFATTTGNRQTSMGQETGQNTATQLDDITTIGYRATAGANKGTALGTLSRADHLGSVALGSDTTTTAVGQVMVGPRDVEITDTTKGLVFRSPDGTRYRIKVANGGVLSTVAA